MRAAAARLAGVARRTPILTSRTLDELSGGSVFLKAENFQRTGSFKIRGAYAKLSSLPPDDLRRGVLAYSSGNHAQAVALSARLLEVPAVILMPEDAPAAKREATRGYGAEVRTFDRYRDDREALGRSMAAERGLILVPPFDDPVVMAGQGTATLELLEDAAPLDMLLVPVGGGGLIAGAATAAKAVDPDVVVYGVEPQEGNDTQRSLAAGERVTIPIPRTIADGLQLPAPGRLTFEVIRRLVGGVVTVTDDEIRDAMAFLFARMKVVVEPSGAVGVAAVLAGKVDVRGRRVGVILSGGNIDPARFCRLLAEAAPP